MNTISTGNYQNVKLISEPIQVRSRKHDFLEDLFRRGCKDIQHCNGIIIGRKDTDYIFYNVYCKEQCDEMYGPIVLSSINKQKIKKLRVTAERLVFLTEEGVVYDLLAQLLHNTNLIAHLHVYFRMFDVGQCMDIETSRISESVILMKTCQGKVYGVGINDAHQLANRDNTFGLREGNLVYDEQSEAFATGYDFTVCSTNKQILVCGRNSNRKLGRSDMLSIKAPAIAVLWRRIFGQVKTIIGLRDMVVMLTDRNVYVSGFSNRPSNLDPNFRMIDLPSTPKAIFGDASSNVFYVATASELYTFDPDADSEEDFLEYPDCHSCGVESHPTVTFVGKLVFVSYDNFHVATKMRRMFDLVNDIGLVTTYHLVDTLDEPAKKKCKSNSGRVFACITRLSVPLGDLDIIVYV
jgi:hypothetical protein